MDLMSRTDLFDRLEQRGTFSEPEAAGMVYNLLVAVRFMLGVSRRTVGGGVSGETRYREAYHRNFSEHFI